MRTMTTEERAAQGICGVHRADNVGPEKGRMNAQRSQKSLGVRHFRDFKKSYHNC